MQIVKIELGNSDYVEVYKEITHKTSRELQRLIRTTLGDNGALELSARLNNAIDLEAKREIIKSIKIDGEDELVLLNQTVKWSFGEVTQDVLDSISETKYQTLKAEVDKLYSAIPLVANS